MKRTLPVFAAAALVLAASCVSSWSGGGYLVIGFGGEQRNIAWPPSSTDIGLLTFVVKMDGPGGVSQEVTVQGSHSVTIQLATGRWQIRAEAFEGNTLYAVGDPQNLDVKPGKNSAQIAMKPAAQVSGVSLSHAALTMLEGQKQTIAAAVSPANATIPGVTWTTSDGAVATVANGVVTAKATGTAVITATTANNKKTASCAVTVVSGVITGAGAWNAAIAIIDAAPDGTPGNHNVFTLRIPGLVQIPGVNVPSIMGDYKTVHLTGTGTIETTTANRHTFAVDLFQTLIIDGPTLKGSSSNGVEVLSIGGLGSAAELRAGAIRDNVGTQYGSGVRVKEDGVFTMTGGDITGNKVPGIAGEGGGVYVNGGTFNMSGGTISGNEAGQGGGGVHVDGGTFNMSEGTISGNEAGQGGGGVAVANCGTFIMTGGLITGNNVTGGTGQGGGVLVIGGGTTFTMAWGYIMGNHADASGSQGGGVAVAPGGTFNLNYPAITGYISGNTAPSFLQVSNSGGAFLIKGANNVTESGTPY